MTTMRSFDSTAHNSLYLLEKQGKFHLPRI